MIQWIRFRCVILGMGFVLLFMSGCGKDDFKFENTKSEEQFIHAKQVFDKRDYYKAKMLFTVIVLNNPGSAIIEQGQYYLAECHFYLKEYLLAVSEYEKLIRSLPKSTFVDDSQYKTGLCYEKLSPGYGLDQEYTHKAISQYQQFLDEYPGSELRPLVEQHLSECVDKLARKEFKTGELYRKMGYLESAVISFDAVLQNYSDSQYADDALYWKGECSRKMKKGQEARDAFTTLLSRFPESPFAEKTRNRLKELTKAGT